MTPVIVAAVNEILSRPVDRVAALREQRRTMVLEARRSEPLHVAGEELRGAPGFALGDDAPEVAENGHRPADALAGVEIYERRRRILHPRVWVITGVVAFAVAAAALTLPELIFGGAVATTHRTTLFGGGSHHAAPSKPKSSTTGVETTPTQAVPAAQQPAETTPTTTTDTGTSTGTETTSTNGGSPAPPGTGTDTSTAPLPPAP